MVVGTAAPPVASNATTGDLVFRVCGSSRHGQLVRLKSAKCTIGSGPNCTLRLRARGIGPVHCLILRGAARTVVRRWSPGTLLNGLAFTDAELTPGDRLNIGAVELEVVQSGGIPVPDARQIRETRSESDAGPPETERLQQLEEASARLQAEIEALQQHRRRLDAQHEKLEQARKQWEADRAEWEKQLRGHNQEITARQAEFDAKREELQRQRERWEADRAESERQLDERAKELDTRSEEFRQQCTDWEPICSGNWTSGPKNSRPAGWN